MMIAASCTRAIVCSVGPSGRSHASQISFLCHFCSISVVGLWLLFWLASSFWWRRPLANVREPQNCGHGGVFMIRQLRDIAREGEIGTEKKKIPSVDHRFALISSAGANDRQVTSGSMRKSSAVMARYVAILGFARTELYNSA